MTGPTQAAYEAAAAQMERLGVLPGDREVALAIFNQARMGPPATRLNEVQVMHLLSIGWSAGAVATRRRVAEEIRAAKVGMLGLPTAPLFAMELVTETAEWAARIAEGGGR